MSGSLAIMKGDGLVLSTTSAYALRTLVCLAQSSPDSALPGHELARRANVPANYLSKVLQLLRHAGVVSATRGLGGGYRLQKGARDAPLLTIVEIFDGERSRPRCLLGQEYRCSDETPCPAHETWKEVRDVYLRFLEETTLSDISQFPLPDRDPIPAGRDDGE